MPSVLIASANIFFSLILGAFALVFVSIQFPELFSYVLDFAGWLEDRIGGTDLNKKYNNWVRFLIGSQQLTFMFFVVTTRILLAIIVTLVGRLRMG
jgi:hypothetical protein